MTWLAAQFRADAVARLQAYPPLAGVNVEASRASAVPDADLPFLAVYSALVDGPAQSLAGAEPRFDVKLHLAIDAMVQSVPLVQAEQLLDDLVGHTLDALISDPAWVRQFDSISAVRVTPKIDAAGAQFSGFAHIVIELAYVERYPPRLGPYLSAIDLTVRHGDQTVQRIIVADSSPAPAAS